MLQRVETHAKYRACSLNAKIASFGDQRAIRPLRNSSPGPIIVIVIGLEEAVTDASRGFLGSVENYCVVSCLNPFDTSTGASDKGVCSKNTRQGPGGKWQRSSGRRHPCCSLFNSSSKTANPMTKMSTSPMPILDFPSLRFHLREAAAGDLGDVGIGIASKHGKIERSPFRFAAHAVSWQSRFNPQILTARHGGLSCATEALRDCRVGIGAKQSIFGFGPRGSVGHGRDFNSASGRCKKKTAAALAPEAFRRQAPATTVVSI